VLFLSGFSSSEKYQICSVLWYKQCLPSGNYLPKTILGIVRCLHRPKTSRVGGQCRERHRGAEGPGCKPRLPKDGCTSPLAPPQHLENEQQTSPGGNALPRLRCSWPLFVCRTPGCNSLFFPRALASANLSGEVRLPLSDKTRS